MYDDDDEKEYVVHFLYKSCHVLAANLMRTVLGAVVIGVLAMGWLR